MILNFKHIQCGARFNTLSRRHMISIWGGSASSQEKAVRLLREARQHRLETMQASASPAAFHHNNSGAYGMDDDQIKKYIRAHVNNDTLDSLDLNALLRYRSPVSSDLSTTAQGFQPYKDPNMSTLTPNSDLVYNAPSLNPPKPDKRAVSFMPAAAPTPTQPHYSGHEQTEKRELGVFQTILLQIFSAVRNIIIAFVVLTMFATIVDDRMGGMKPIGNLEYEPQPNTKKITFDDVKGVSEAKDELLEIVEFLKNPHRFTRLGGKLPKGVLLMGSPGTGKTLLARAIAGEAGVPFFYCSGSDFEEMFVGVGAKRVRELFAAAKKKQPCIVFIDELDAIGSSRNPKDQGHMKMTLNQLLVELDGFNQNDGIIIIGATNFPESLDPALIRPGRFDKRVVVPNPDLHGREEILRLYLDKSPLHADIDIKTIAKGCVGLSGAELANIVNQAAIKASLDDKETISMADIEYAKDKIIMGAERKSAVIDEKNRRLVAVHESGHAIVALHSKGAMPIHKATIMPRGQTLGFVAQLPENDDAPHTKEELLARLDVCMGGRAAEELVYGEFQVTVGASSDFEQATRIATSMVTKLGMSTKVGHVILNKEGVISPESLSLVETEVKALCEAAYINAKQILQRHATEMTLLSEALLEYETLDLNEIKKVLRSEKLERP